MWQCKSELTDTVSLMLIERAEHLAASTDLSNYFLTLLLGMPAAVRSGILDIVLLVLLNIITTLQFHYQNSEQFSSVGMQGRVNVPFWLQWHSPMQKGVLREHVTRRKSLPVVLPHLWFATALGGTYVQDGLSLSCGVAFDGVVWWALGREETTSLITARLPLALLPLACRVEEMLCCNGKAGVPYCPLSIWKMRYWWGKSSWTL